MDRHRRLFALPALSALALAFGCAGPPVSAPIEGIPVCPDFATGNAKMEGGLRFPVRLRVLDGKNLLYRTVISGLRSADAPKPYSFIADDNARYRVEWAQCSNPRAPHSVAELAHGHKKARDKARDGEGTAYDCGEATVYKPDGVLETKKGDRGSHVINFLPPPNPECWADEAPPPSGAGAEPGDAGAAAVPASDAGAAVPAGDGGVATPAGDAGAAPVADAGAVKAKP